MHVCGDIGGVIDNLIKMPVDILDFEFSCNPENLEIISKKELNGKQIGFGAVDSTFSGIDSVETIKARIEKGIEIFGAENLLIDPDCGLRMHTREVAFGKLKNMVLATDEIRLNL
jgi:5-methyltetrahydropteroyltriglutamate--homocysteine methyltransferase